LPDKRRAAQDRKQPHNGIELVRESRVTIGALGGERYQKPAE